MDGLSQVNKYVIEHAKINHVHKHNIHLHSIIEYLNFIKITYYLLFVNLRRLSIKFSISSKCFVLLVQTDTYVANKLSKFNLKCLYVTQVIIFDLVS